MKHNLITLSIAAVTILLSIVSCGDSQNKEVDNSAKLQYSPEINKVEVIELKKVPFRKQLISNGRLRAVSRADLSFKTSGVVADVNFTEGARVTKGAVIASIESESQRLAFESAQISMRKAEYDLYDLLAGLGHTAKDTLSVEKDVLSMAKMRSGYDNAHNALLKSRYDLDGCRIVAPFSGKVANLKAKKHSPNPSEPACTIVDDSRMEVEFSVIESEYSFLSKGLDVIIIPYADMTISVMGEIKSVNPSVDDKGKIKVTALVKNDGRLIDGMNVKVIVEKEISDQFVVPKSAVLIRDNLDVLFIYKDGKAQWTYVNIVMSNSESHSVIANTDRGAVLNDGDQIIISGNLNLADGSTVTLQ